MNDLWNLLPADHWFNEHKKRDRLPSEDLLVAARPRLELAHDHYGAEKDRAEALTREVGGRFSALTERESNSALAIANAVSAYLRQLAESRNITRFDARGLSATNL